MEEQVKQPSPTPQTEGAVPEMVFKQLFPLFLSELHKLSKKQVVRVVENILVGILEEEAVAKLKTIEEKRVFTLGRKMFDAQLLMFHNVLNKYEFELVQKQAEEEKLKQEETVKNANE